MRLKELAVEFKAVLVDSYGEIESQALFFAALEHVAGYNRVEYAFRKEDVLSSKDQDRLLMILNELEAGRPLQYVIEETLFYGLPIKVNASVLIPRPETEELVNWMLEALKFRGEKEIEILDIGTGSGCIALALKKYLPNSGVSALDVSNEALSVAMENSIINQLNINFISADIRTYNSDRKFDVIVSNPPYITAGEQSAMSKHVLSQEPHLALFVHDENPLEFYVAISEFALSNLSDQGMLFFEINESFGKEIVAMLENKGFKNIELRKDMQGKDRMIGCSRT